MSNEVTRTPAQVAADINTIKSHTSAVLRSAIDEGKRSCIRIGKLLEEAKCLVPHGEWGKWLEENVDYSESTAQNLMRCYREFGDEQIDLFSGVSDADFFAVLSQSQMLELLALPKERRREFVEEHREELESGEMSVRDLKAEIAEQLRKEFNTELEAVHEEYDEKIKALERERDEAETDAAKADALEEQLAKAKIDNNAAMDKLKADHAKKLADLEASYKKQAKASAAGADANVTRIQISLENFKRDLTSVSAILGKMRAEGGEQAQKAEKLQANVEKILGGLISEAGWTL